jgi:sortase A
MPESYKASKKNDKIESENTLNKGGSNWFEDLMKRIRKFLRGVLKSIFPKKFREKVENFLPKIKLPDWLRKTLNYMLASICIFLVLMPVIPEIIYYFKQVTGTFELETVEIRDETGLKGGDENESEQLPEGNTLIIPAIGLRAPVVEGSDETALSRGAWRRPNTSTPDEGGNTVITGHRFEYLPPNNLTFYHLDKVEEGDKIQVYWEDELYEYEVESIFVVDPSAVEVEDDTEESQLTLYTCTPLWTAKNRLVIVADLLEKNENEADQDDEEDQEVEDSEASAV